MENPKACARACQFIAPDYAAAEARAHGRARDPARPDELHFGPFRAMWRARLKAPLPGAQWSGITTRLAERLLETGAVEAVLTVAPDPADRWRPVPVLVTRAEDLARCRGMRMVYALRALEAELGFERICVIGTPCSDNTTTENFHRFLDLLDERPDEITYLEFRADFHVELRYRDDRRREIPFLQLPISQLPADFFPMTCRSCVDYTNALADITVGYMGGEGRQWILVRNAHGEEILRLLEAELELSRPGSAGNRAGPVKGFLENTRRAAGGLPLRRMPAWLRPIMGWLMPRLGPKGLEFARARVEMKAVESILHLERAEPARAKRMIPAHVRELARPYGLGAPAAGEGAPPRG
jgi:coenzyme F420 hydrogenase subunit beta